MNTMKASDKLGTYYYLIAYTLPVNGQPVQLSQVIMVIIGEDLVDMRTTLI